MRWPPILLFPVAALLSLQLAGQDTIVPPKRQQCFLDKKYFTSYVKDGADVVRFPARWNESQWIGATITASATILLIAVDDHIQQWSQCRKIPALDLLSRYVFEPVGSGLYSLPALGILYSCGMIWKDNRARITALKGLEAYILSGLASQIIKQMTHRHRPYQDDPPDPTLWDGPFQGFSHTSFPSGHAATAFAVATVVSLSYRQTIWVPILCYTLATGAALSRIYDNQHWASDVLVGSAIGFGIGQLVARNESRLQLIPASPVGQGVSLIYRF